MDREIRKSCPAEIDVDKCVTVGQSLLHVPAVADDADDCNAAGGLVNGVEHVDVPDVERADTP